MRTVQQRFWLVGVFIAVMMTATGCGLFSSTDDGGGNDIDLTAPAPMCTPPACAEGETLHCPDGNCPGGCGYACTLVTPITDPEVGVAPADWAGVESWLTNAWNEQNNPAAVRAGLRAAGWLDGYNNWVGVDLDGDLREEWIITLVDPDQTKITAWGRPGNLWVVNGSGVAFRVYETPEGNDFGNTAPEITGIADMTNDGRPELVINQVTCGASTCYGNYTVLSTIRGDYENIVDSVPVSEEVPDDNVISISYSEASFNDFERDGLVELQVHGGAQGSAGAGIVQTYTELWAWDGTAVTLKDRFYDASNYRHHYLYEANRLMEKGLYEDAIYYYEEAINNGALITPETFTNTGEVYSAISQFAAARLVQIDLMQGESGRASGRANWMQQNFAGTAVTNATVRLVNEWTGEDSNMATLCSSIEEGLADIEQPFGPLSNQMGYGNPALGAADFCP